MPAQRRAVFLDRDGVINRSVVRDGAPRPPDSVDELEILPGVAEGVRILRDAGFVLIVATNQPDVARGKQTMAAIDAIHARLTQELGLDDFRVCAHDDRDACACRKPKPGLLIDAARDREISLDASYMVGDRWRDIEAGQAAGCRTVFIDHAYDERQPDAANFTTDSLLKAAEWIVRQTVE